MLAVALFGIAAAACGLGASVDPNGACVTDANGWSTLDADSDSAIPISLAISTKAAHTDAFSTVHSATAGTLTDATATDSRYVLACPQAAGEKTVQMSVSRPADLTAFGAEWVQLFPKDSWENVTNEYEPFTFNEFGAKIPLPQFRPTTTGLTNDAADEDVVHVFMEVKDEGDYEVKYGNPSLVSDGKWVAVEFKETLIRVGTPWADCSDSILGSDSYDVGSIMPILFGGPNTNSISLQDGNPSYFDVISELSGVTVPVKVVLEIFNADKTTYTDSTVDGQCYKAGNACPEAHLVCKAEYCEMDVWKALIANFKAAGTVAVLGSVDSSTTTSQYSDLDMDGFYFTSAVETITTPGALIQQAKNTVCTHFITTQAECEAAGTQFFGNGNINYASTTGWAGYPVGCFWHDHPHGRLHWTTASPTPNAARSDTWPLCHAAGSEVPYTGYSVLGLGSPLFDETAVDAATVYVTLASSDLGIWNPFSWYPYVSPLKWSAIVTDAADVSAVATLFDRGYGYVYLTSEAGLDTKSTIMTALLAEIEGTATRRKLQERRLQASEPFWGCDDTLFECQPICLKKTGYVTMKVSNTLCTAAPIEPCSCQCYWSAQWTCEDESVVCKARLGAGPLKTVGDKVCVTRGAPKPASTAELRTASQCEPFTEMRGSAPTAQCMEEWATPEPTAAAAVPSDDSRYGTEAPAEATVAPLIAQSFASALALTALAYYA
jgi:hypothetical protein